MIMKPQLLSNSSLCAIIAGLLISCCGNAMGAVIYIPDNYQTIQQGINAASAGDTVIVRDGTYLLTEAIDFKGKAVTLKSENGASNCIRDGQGQTRVVYFHGGETRTSTLSGFTIQNGQADKGGAVYCEQSSPTITKCTIRRNNVNAESGQGGAIYLKSSSASITYCIISDNRVSTQFDSSAFGGGIYSSASSPNISNCLISGNTAYSFRATAFGGGAYIEGGSPVISGVSVVGNISSSSYFLPYGGGIFFNSSSPFISNSIITNNSASDSGGGVYASSSFLSAENLIINGNSSQRGAGIYLDTSFANLTNCTILRNIAASEGGGLYCANSSPQVVNCILREDLPTEILKSGTGNPKVTYSDVSGGYTGTGNIDADPLFVDIAGQDFHLKSNSPCRDTGDNSASYLPKTDMDGNARIWNGIVDMGAYEYQSCSLPGKASLISPSGKVGTATPAYTWNAVSTATWYLLWVNDATGNKINQWYTAEQAGCSSGTGTCSVTPATALGSGAGYFKIQTYNACGYGPWSEELGFSVAVGGVPGKATLVSPTGTISTTTPTFIWNAVSSATWYQLWVNDSTGSSKIKAWYTTAQAGCAAGAGSCSATSTTALASGSGQWWIQTWNDSGYGPWSDPFQFTIVTGGTPGKATLVSPTGTITTTTPTYIWNAVSAATWYYLWVNDNAGVPRIQAWYTAGQAGCGSGTGLCSVTSGIGLTLGSGQWWIQTWNDSGYGPWSDPMQFMVTVSGIRNVR